MRSLMSLFKRKPDPADVSIPPAPKRVRAKPDWRCKALKAAAERHGKPFKVGPDHLAHEVMVVPSEYRVKRPGEMPENVEPIKKVRKA